MGTGWTTADLDGDGIQEAVGTDSYAGAVVYAPLDSSGTVVAQGLTDAGFDPHRARSGDFDGDGHADVSVEVEDSSVAILPGPIVPGASALVAPDQIAVSSLLSEEVGDTNCDGTDDLVLAWDDGFIRRISLDQSVVAGAVDAAALVGWHGEYPGDGAGDDMVMGDLDGDGCADLAVTAQLYGSFGYERAGALYILLDLP